MKREVTVQRCGICMLGPQGSLERSKKDAFPDTSCKCHKKTFTRGRMISKSEEGSNLTRVAEEFGINKSVVSRAWKGIQMVVTVVRKIGGGRPRKTMASDDRHIALHTKRDQNQT
ncbi:hypothetical protein TNCV_4506751 [Trichonephila clavipes]|nr:hypothetical protein TNCV_4506751 [Trichonephila clavipes]